MIYYVFRLTPSVLTTGKYLKIVMTVHSKTLNPNSFLKKTSPYDIYQM